MPRWFSVVLEFINKLPNLFTCIICLQGCLYTLHFVDLVGIVMNPAGFGQLIKMLTGGQHSAPADHLHIGCSRLEAETQLSTFCSDAPFRGLHILLCTGPLTPPTNIKHCGCQSCASIENVLNWQYCASVFNNSIYIRT